ncbi:hypothetical protein LCGC14_2155120, partial [marine sediment metagenome]
MEHATIKAKILRFDPDRDEKPYFQSYVIPVDEQITVYELLNIIHRDVKPHNIMIDADGEPPEARPITLLARTWRWCRRKPLTAGLTATTGSLLLFLAI